VDVSTSCRLRDVIVTALTPAVDTSTVRSLVRVLPQWIHLTGGNHAPMEGAVAGAYWPRRSIDAGGWVARMVLFQAVLGIELLHLLSLVVAPQGWLS
jgi:hypothetical protein